VSDFFGGDGNSVARGRNRWGYKNPFLYPVKTFSNKNLVDRPRMDWLQVASGWAVTGSPTWNVRGSNSLYNAWNFDAATVYEVQIPLFTPSANFLYGMSHYSPSNPFQYVRIYWTNLGAGAGSVVWQVTIKSTGFSGDLNNSSVTTHTAGLNGVAVAAQGQNLLTYNDYDFTSSTILLDQAVGWVVRVRRIATDAGDTLANDAGLVAAALVVTADM